MKIRDVFRCLARLLVNIDCPLSRSESRVDISGVHLGEGSIIKSLRKLHGAQYISIGSHSSVGEQSWLAAFDQYEEIKYTPRLAIGNNVCIGDYACITCIDEIIIGDGCLFSEYVYISDHMHGFVPGAGPLVRQTLTSKGPVVIGNNTFLGYRACVLPGVRLGSHCVVGANSVVTKSASDYSMLAGVPAKVIKEYSHDAQCWISVDELN